MCTQTERAHSQPQLGQAFNSAASLLSPLFNCCQVGQRLLVPTHVFGDEAVACDRQARPCAGQRCSLCGDLVGLGLISGAAPTACKFATRQSCVRSDHGWPCHNCNAVYVHQAPSNFVFDGIVRRRTRGRASCVDARVCVKVRSESSTPSVVALRLGYGLRWLYEVAL